MKTKETPLKRVLNAVGRLFVRSYSLKTSLKADGTPADWLAYFFGQTVSSGVKVDYLSAMSVPAIQQAVRIYAETIASLPWEVFQTDGTRTDKDNGHDLYELFNARPSPLYSSYTFRKTLVTHYFLHGKACAVINRNANGRPVEFLIVQPNDVEPFYDGNILFYNVCYRAIENGPVLWERMLPAMDVIYLQDVTFDGLDSKSRVMLAKESVGLSLAATEYPAKYIKNGGHFNGILSTDLPLKKEQAEQISEKWERRGGFDNAGKTPLLPYGIKYTPVSSDPEKMTLSEIRRFQVEEVSRIFNLPPHLLNHLDRMSFNNVEAIDRNVVKYSFRPVIKQIEQEFNYKCFRARERGNTYSRMNLEGLLRGAAKDRAEFYQLMIQNRVMNPNEARKLENWNPYEGGDNYENPNITPGTAQNSEENED